MDENLDTSAQDTTQTDVMTDITETTNTTTETTDESAKETQSAPEEYADFTVPEGMTFDKESASDFLTTAKELNLTQEQAQKLVDLYGTRMVSMQESQQKQSEEWANESKKQYKKADIEIANKTLSKFADQEFIDLLAVSGLGNHPKMIGLFNKIGSQMSEGQFVDTGSNAPAKSAAEILYPSMKK